MSSLLKKISNGEFESMANLGSFKKDIDIDLWYERLLTSPIGSDGVENKGLVSTTTIFLDFTHFTFS